VRILGGEQKAGVSGITAVIRLRATDRRECSDCDLLTYCYQLKKW